MFETHKRVVFDYVNYKGEVSKRDIIVLNKYFGATSYYPNKQWLVEGFDLGKNKLRTFNLDNMTNPKRVSHE